MSAISTSQSSDRQLLQGVNSSNSDKASDRVSQNSDQASDQSVSPVSGRSLATTELHAADNANTKESLQAGIAKAISFLEELNLLNPLRKRFLEDYMENNKDDSRSLKRLHAGLHLLIYLAAESKGIPESSESTSLMAFPTRSERELLLEDKIGDFLLKLTTDYHLRGRKEYSPRRDPLLQVISSHHKYGIQPYAIQSYISLAELMLQKREASEDADPASLLTLALEDWRSEHEAYMAGLKRT